MPETPHQTPGRSTAATGRAMCCLTSARICSLAGDRDRLRLAATIRALQARAKQTRTKRRCGASLLLLVLLALTGARSGAQARAASDPPAARTPVVASLVELRGGHWFDGARFVTGSRWMRNGTFVAPPAGRRSPRADSIVDLSGRWMVPPFGDAHTHSPDGAWGFDAIRDMYLRLGVFYVQTLANHRSGRLALAGQVNVPTSVDVVFADGAVTSTGGHPQVLYESLATLRRFWQTDAERYAAARSFTQDGDVYHRLDSLSQLPALVTLLARDTLPVLKIMLLGSERWAAGVGDSTRAGLRGIDPALVTPLVAAAHGLGRTVWAHVETAADFRIALDAGIDGFAHTPGYGAAGEADSALAKLLLPDALVRQAGRQRVLMTPTLALARGGAGTDSAKLRRFDAVTVRNARALRRAGVRMVVGSDTYSNADVIVNDVTATAELLALSPLEQLRLWAIDTPRTIFPDRRIARLAPGYEASALALLCDPLANRACTGRIGMRLKQGTWLDVPPAPAATAP